MRRQIGNVAVEEEGGLAKGRSGDSTPLIATLRARSTSW
jgi:hypothetical protein